MTEQKRSNLPWILAGCGLLAVFGCCITGAVGAGFYRFKAASEEAASAARFDDAESARLAEEAQRQPPTGPLEPGFVGTPSVTVMATVTRATGRRLTVRAGEACFFSVSYPERSDQPGERWCQTSVRCGGQSLYGGGTGGYFTCTFSQSPAAVRGSDDATTTSDRDGAMSIDTAAGTLRIRDDSTGDHGAFELDATITRTM